MPGGPQRLNSLPMSMAVSPDGRYVVTVNAGYGTFESGYMQSLAVMDTQTGAVTDFPDDADAGQWNEADAVFGAGVQSRMASISMRAWVRTTILLGGDGRSDTGSGVVVYGFDDGKDQAGNG